MTAREIRSAQHDGRQWAARVWARTNAEGRVLPFGAVTQSVVTSEGGEKMWDAAVGRWRELQAASPIAVSP